MREGMDLWNSQPDIIEQNMIFNSWGSLNNLTKSKYIIIRNALKSNRLTNLAI